MYSFTRTFSSTFTHLVAQVAAAIPLPGPARFLALPAPARRQARRPFFHAAPSPLRGLASAGRALVPQVAALPSAQAVTPRAAFFLPPGELAPTSAQLAYYHPLLRATGQVSSAFLLAHNLPPSMVYCSRREASAAITTLLAVIHREEAVAAARREESERTCRQFEAMFAG